MCSRKARYWRTLLPGAFACKWYDTGWLSAAAILYHTIYNVVLKFLRFLAEQDKRDITHDFSFSGYESLLKT